MLLDGCSATVTNETDQAQQAYAFDSKDLLSAFNDVFRRFSYTEAFDSHEAYLQGFMRAVSDQLSELFWYRLGPGVENDLIYTANESTSHEQKLANVFRFAGYLMKQASSNSIEVYSVLASLNEDPLKDLGYSLQSLGEFLKQPDGYTGGALSNKMFEVYSNWVQNSRPGGSCNVNQIERTFLDAWWRYMGPFYESIPKLSAAEALWQEYKQYASRIINDDLGYLAQAIARPDANAAYGVLLVASDVLLRDRSRLNQAMRHRLCEETFKYLRKPRVGKMQEIASSDRLDTAAYAFALVANYLPKDTIDVASELLNQPALKNLIDLNRSHDDFMKKASTAVRDIRDRFQILADNESCGEFSQHAELFRAYIDAGEKAAREFSPPQ